MNFRQIEILLENYFNGETSLEDEKTLRRFFQQENIPKHLVSLKTQFEYFSSEHDHNYLDESFDKKLLKQINNNESCEKRFFRKRNLYVISGIAASVLIIVSLFIDPFTSKIKNTLDDPYQAYMETKKAIQFVSNAFNKGLKPTGKLASYNDGIKQLSKISSFNTGIEQSKKIVTFYDTQKKILNN
jgi:hypothetical protein